tara:strand:+ start:1016 stop:1678 length:663 start_codon:yes stop_codon:yes gene_type:complete
MNIDKIFVINLEHRTDRKKQIVEELEKQNITNYEIFKAIRPTPEDITLWNNRYCFHVREPRNFPTLNKFMLYQIGCLGCLLSHVQVCKLALERNYKNILILEDDTQFIHNLDKLQEFSSQINNDYDMLYLCGSHLGHREKVSENIIKVRGTHTTGSYLITENAMKYLVNNVQSYLKEIDVFYADEIQPRFKCYCVTPHITKQRDGYSDIQQGNVSYNFKQ